MQEVTEFLNKLTKSDSVLVTELENRAYCRFLLNGQYVDRMFVTDPNLLAELLLLVGAEYAIDAAGVAKLKQFFPAFGAPSAVDMP